MTSDFLKSTGEKQYAKLGTQKINIASSICTNNITLNSMSYIDSQWQNFSVINKTV